MSRREDIDNGIWSDPDFDALSNDAALLYLWSFTNPNCGMAGIYKIARRKLGEGRLMQEQLDAALEELSNARFAFYYEGVLWVRTRVKFLRTKGEMMERSIRADLEKLPSCHRLLEAFCDEYRHSWISDVIEGFEKGPRGVPKNGGQKPKKRTPREPLKGSQGYGKGKGNGFQEWLDHYKETTGRPLVRGSKPARDAFAARLRDGYALDDLKLATVGCHGDEFCRDRGYDVPDTILRASKVDRYIELGRGPRIVKTPPTDSPYEAKVREMAA